MKLNKDITLDYVLYGLKSRNKREVMRDIARFVSKQHGQMDEVALFDQLLDQERQASSAIGMGLAIPHIRLNDLKTPLNMLVHLDKPVSFDSPDGEDVQAIWVTMSPRADGPRHLMRLAKISRMLNNPQLAKQLKQARSLDELRALLFNVEHDLLEAA
tara:strand:- start:10184 stop:10657 length:474 start_codon:yes stop_codon:yes gene_type:complete